MLDQQYITRALATCPSLDPRAQAGLVVGYHYRYNTQRVIKVAGDHKHVRNALSEHRANIVLFNDAADYRRHGTATDAVRLAHISNMNTQWAHREGGNIVDHQGAVRFKRNRGASPVVYGWPGESLFRYSANDDYLSQP